MSYHVTLVHQETRARYEAAADPGFFEEPGNLVALSQVTRDGLALRLEQVGFREDAPDRAGRCFTHEGWPAQALLTDTGLYLSAWGQDGIFEALMFASECVTDELAKFDPQTDTWE